MAGFCWVGGVIPHPIARAGFYTGMSAEPTITYPIPAQPTVVSSHKVPWECSLAFAVDGEGVEVQVKGRGLLPRTIPKSLGPGERDKQVRSKMRLALLALIEKEFPAEDAGGGDDEAGGGNEFHTIVVTKVHRIKVNFEGERERVRSCFRKAKYRDPLLAVIDAVEENDWEKAHALYDALPYHKGRGYHLQEAMGKFWWQSVYGNMRDEAVEETFKIETLGRRPPHDTL